IWPVYGGQNGPKSIVSVAPKAELWTPLGLFGQSRKRDSAKFAVASNPSGTAPSTRQPYGGPPRASKRGDLVPFVTVVYQGVATRNIATTREILAHQTGARPNFA